MATALDPALTKKTFNNWLKGALAVLFTREGLTEFVKAEIFDFQRDLLQSIFTKNGIPLCTTCCSCTTANMLRCPTQDFCDKRGKCKLHDPNVPNKKPNQKCPKSICRNVKDAILKQHRFQGPSWHITDATKWCSDPFQIAKCYLPPKGYDNKGSFDELDFNGTLGVIINNTRFQNLLTAQINTVCSKVRDMINETIRHSANYELSDVQLARCIDALRDLLQDSKFLLHDQHAQDAVNKLNQLQNNTLFITAGDITKVLDEDISKRISEQQQEAIQSILDHLANVQKASVASLQKIMDERDKSIEAIQQEAEQQIKAIKQVGAVTMVTDDVLFKDLTEDIITYYREHESVIPASPLVDEHNVPIEELYVLPPLWAYTNSYFEPSKKRHKEDETSGNNEQEKQKTTISQIFFSCDVRYRKIYITANAGFGKTSLSQKLTMTWCQSHSPLTSLTEHYDDEELAAMKYFDLLFLLHLRDYQNELKCNLDDLIMIMLSANMSRKSQYTNEFIERILHEKKCLVILDGLDEWSHPGHCPRKPAVPHNNHPGSCTVLTTTRDWKIGTIGLSPKDIDRRVEILMLDDEKRNLLEKNTFEILNKRNLNLAGKTIDDFEKNVKPVPIGDIVYIPYILLQLMCLFFGGIPIGKNKCEIYSNITEFTLKRGLNKKDLPDIHVQSNDNAAIAKCMNKNETCIRYFTLLKKLWTLAFYTLFSEKKESSLTFDRRIVTQYMTEQEIEFCLKVGLLCQTKDTSIIAEKFYKVFFQHKSVHEFLSAIYITSEGLNESVKLTILKMCSSLSSTLEMENLFVFVCGMNPEVYTCISGELQKIGDIDRVTRRYSIFVNNDVMKTLNSYQLMQLQCLHESMRNGHKSCPIYLYLMLNSDNYSLVALKAMIRFNKCRMKSLLIPHLDENIKAFLDPGVFTYLETLRVEHCDKKPVWLTDILTESVRTLKCLTLSPQDKSISLSDISITALTGLTCLQSLCLEDVHITHSNIECLYACISQTTTLTQLKLETINCTHHKFRYDCDVTLDLHRLNELKLLHLDSFNMPHSGLKCFYAYISLTTKLTNLKLTYINCLDHYNDCGVILDLNYLNKLKTLHLTCVPCKDLQVNPACLEELKFDTRGRKMTARASAILWQDLRAAPVLSSLTLDSISSCQEMIQTIPTLTQLQYLRLNRIDMGEIIPRVSPTMTKMERVVLYKIKMSSAAWRKLFISFDQLPRSFTVNLSSITMTSQEWRELLFSVCVMQHPVTVELNSCEGPSREEWQTIKNGIKSTRALSLSQDFISESGSASLIVKNKAVSKWQILNYR